VFSAPEGVRIGTEADAVRRVTFTSGFDQGYFAPFLIVQPKQASRVDYATTPSVILEVPKGACPTVRLVSSVATKAFYTYSQQPVMTPYTHEARDFTGTSPAEFDLCSGPE
jgi:hypothetical protein